MLAGLKKVAYRRGSRPSQWFVSFSPVPSDKWLAIEIWDGKKWVPAPQQHTETLMEKLTSWLLPYAQVTSPFLRCYYGSPTHLHARHDLAVGIKAAKQQLEDRLWGWGEK